MIIEEGNGTTKYGPGVSIKLDGVEVARAILAYLTSQGVDIDGAKTIRVNGELVDHGDVYVDPSGDVYHEGRRYSGRGLAEEKPKEQPLTDTLPSERVATPEGIEKRNYCNSDRMCELPERLHLMGCCTHESKSSDAYWTACDSYWPGSRPSCSCGKALKESGGEVVIRRLIVGPAGAGKTSYAQGLAARIESKGGGPVEIIKLKPGKRAKELRAMLDVVTPEAGAMLIEMTLGDVNDPLLMDMARVLGADSITTINTYRASRYDASGRAINRK
jgi:hypothetical protein